MTYLPIGSIFHGTMKPADLIRAGLDALSRVDRDAAYGYATEWLVHLADASPEDISGEQGEAWCALCDLLDGYAPPYCYVGSLEGDGADVGVWPCIDSLEEAVRDGDVLKVGDLACIPDGYAGEVMHVNDHGNVAFGYVAPDGAFVEMWSVV